MSILCFFPLPISVKLKYSFNIRNSLSFVQAPTGLVGWKYELILVGLIKPLNTLTSFHTTRPVCHSLLIRYIWTYLLSRRILLVCLQQSCNKWNYHAFLSNSSNLIRDKRIVGESYISSNYQCSHSLMVGSLGLGASGSVITCPHKKIITKYDNIQWSAD